MKVGNQIEVKDVQWTLVTRLLGKFLTPMSSTLFLYKEGHSSICYLSDFFLRSGTVCYDIGSSTGTLLLSIYDRHLNIKDVEYIG